MGPSLPGAPIFYRTAAPASLLLSGVVQDMLHCCLNAGPRLTMYTLRCLVGLADSWLEQTVAVVVGQLCALNCAVSKVGVCVCVCGCVFVSAGHAHCGIAAAM